MPAYYALCTSKSFSLEYDIEIHLLQRSGDTGEYVLGTMHRSLAQARFFVLDSPVRKQSDEELRNWCKECIANNDDLAPRATVYEGWHVMKPEVEDSKGCALKLAIVVPPPPLPSRPATPSFGLPSIHERYNRVEILEKVARSYGKPSSEAEPKNMRDRQHPSNILAAYNGRPLHLAPPPIAIFHPVFAQMTRESREPARFHDFTADEIDAAYKFLLACAQNHLDEAEFQEALQDFNFIGTGRPHFWYETSIKLSGGQTRSMRPDGCSFVDLVLPGSEAVRAYTALGELKLGEQKADASMQAMATHMHLVSHNKRYELIRQHSCCPVLLVALSGDILIVWGGAYGERFLYQPLITIRVGLQPSIYSDDPGFGGNHVGASVLEVAKVLRVLKRGVNALYTYYEGLLSSLSKIKERKPSRPGCRAKSNAGGERTQPFEPPPASPHWSTFIIEEVPYKLQYTEMLVPDSIQNTVYCATVTPPLNDGTDKVVVKFTHCYGEEGHRLLADNGLAPKLYYCAYEHTVDMIVAVMAFMPGKVSGSRVSLSHKQQGDLKRAVDLLHGADLVFGDLRMPNIITYDDTVALVDFEWCGAAVDDTEKGKRQARYPVDINLSDIEWAPGVRRYGRIEKAHDLFMLESLCTDV
ncbi:hypothetical protein C8Q78DRAFT_1073381 [Trametes maxima]|nr:hypothetical protein C8Q78DRAFT_1073381 [Trametes maxima]